MIKEILFIFISILMLILVFSGLICLAAVLLPVVIIFITYILIKNTIEDYKHLKK